MGKRITVRQGDTLVSLAHEHKVLSWESIWAHPQNAGLRAKRSDAQALLPGDSLYVPGPGEGAPWVADVRTGTATTFALAPPETAVFAAQLVDDEGAPYTDRRYLLKVAGQSFEGRTGPDGWIEHEVPPDARTGELTLWRDDEDPEDKRVWSLEIGSLNPVETISGVKGRLTNLHYYHGPIDEVLDDEAREALSQFLRDEGLKVPEGDVLTIEVRRALAAACGE